jgi:hypothetical protein
MSQPDAKPKYNVAGTAAMLIIGLLVLVPSGLCTGFLGGGALIGAILDPNEASEGLSTFVMALVIGGPFVAAGVALVWLAVKRMRGR